MIRRIAFVINGLDFGGTETGLAILARRMHERGHHVQVVSLKPAGRVARTLGGDGLSVTSLEMPESVCGAALVSACWRLSKWLRHTRPEIVHSLLPRSNVTSCLALKLARLKVPHVASERSTDFKRRHAVTWLNRWTLRRVSHVVAVSTDVRDVLLDRERVPAHKVSVIGNGVDVERVDATPPAAVREDLGLDPADVVLGSAGRLVPDKGHLYLIRALARLRARQRIHLLIVGEGPEEPRLRAEAAALGVTDRVHFLGYQAGILGILKVVDLFVLPSLEEGIPMVLLEAMACARPVVATNVGGIHRLIQSGSTGLLVSPAEIWTRPAERGRVDSAHAAVGVAALVACIDRLIGDPATASELGRRARQAVCDRFSVNLIMDRWESLYQRLSPTATLGPSELNQHPSPVLISTTSVST